MQPSEVRGKRFSIIGGARSGLAVAKLLRVHGATVFVSDSAPEEKMRKSVEELRALGIECEFGRNSEKVLDAEFVVLSPGVPSDVAIVKDARRQGCTVVGEIEVASWFCPAKIIAVTGTNGKTTTTALLGRIFEDAKQDSVVAGNIGTAFSEVVTGTKDSSTAILEISSFQLDTIETFRPKVSVLLNITPDHLDRYEHSFEMYIASKCRIFENQRSGDVVVYNLDDTIVRRRVEEGLPSGVMRLPFSLTTRPQEGAYLDGGALSTTIGAEESQIVPVDQISIKGQHNLSNAMAASLAARVMGIPTASLRATLRNFKGVEHRLEFTRTVNGVTYVNDSKATNVDSVWYALQSFEEPIVLLLGGRDKGNDYAPLVPLVKKHVRAIVAIGESADKVVNAFSQTIQVVKVTTMAEAVKIATGLASRGDVVLLSPACASFDWFDNYEHRGKVFKELVASL